MTWKTMLQEASKLPQAELKRHAAVSLDNQHACRDCFTCACLAVQQYRAGAYTFSPPPVPSTKWDEVAWIAYIGLPLTPEK